MTNKKFNTISDFLEDDSFKNWARNQKLSDATFWENWIENNPDKKFLALEAKDIILGIKFHPYLISKEKIDFAWDKLSAKIDSKEHQKDKKTRKNTFAKWAGIAASFILVSILSFYLFSKNDHIVHNTGFGETLDLKLQDGSTVTLNANSSIRYSKDNPRKVWLNGEAFFEVDKKHSTNAKFWVMTNDLDVEVYGTVFNVNTRKEKTQVYLQEGNIWLALKNGSTRKMIPGNYLSYSFKENRILEDKEYISPINKTSWKDGKLIFSNLPLEEAMDKVTETYGYKVVYNTNFDKNIFITGTIPTTNIDICIQAIQKSANIKIEKEGNKLLIYNL